MFCDVAKMLVAFSLAGARNRVFLDGRLFSFCFGGEGGRVGGGGRRGHSNILTVQSNDVTLLTFSSRC